MNDERIIQNAHMDDMLQEADARAEYHHWLESLEADEHDDEGETDHRRGRESEESPVPIVPR